MPRREVRLPTTEPWNWLGHSISIFITGSSSTGSRLAETPRASPSGRRSGTPCRSCRPRGTSRLPGRPPGRPPDSSAIGPLASIERKPFSTAGMNCLGIRPPTTSSSKRKFSSASSGSTSSRPTMWAYWPEPPVCLLVPGVELGGLRGRLAVVHLAARRPRPPRCTRGGSARRRSPGAARPCRR